MPKRRSLTFPDPAPLTLAFGSLLDVLRSDPVLTAVRLTVRALDGDYHPDGLPLALVDPREDELPLIRVIGETSSWRWESESEHRAQWPIRIELFVPGCNQDDLTDLWHYVAGAIFPADPARKAEVDAAFGVRVSAIRSQIAAGPATPLGVPASPLAPGSGPAVVGASAYGLKSSGTVQLIVYVPT